MAKVGQIASIVFFITIGLLYLGVVFPYAEVIIGVSAMVVGIIGLVNLLQP